MLVKVNSIGKNSVNITELDIDDFGSVIPLKNVDLVLPSNDDSIAMTLKASPYAAVFTQDGRDEQGSMIILARGMTHEDLNKEKEHTIDKVHKRK